MAEQPLTLQRLLGWLMAPLVWLIGIPWQEAQAAGALMGVKTALNEFLAYLQMAELDADQLSDRSRLIMTYALCGFANFGSLGIMIGGMGTTIGTSTNLLVVGIAADLGQPELQMFDFSVPVLMVGSVGILFLWAVAPRMLPNQRPPMAEA